MTPELVNAQITSLRSEPSPDETRSDNGPLKRGASLEATNFKAATPFFSTTTGLALTPFGRLFAATVRLHYRISELSADKITTSLVKYRPINYLFYCVENDRYDINHIHLLLNATSTIDRNSIAKGLGKYGKSVSYFDDVISNTAISWYCSKKLNQNIPYDLKFKEQYH